MNCNLTLHEHQINIDSKQEEASEAKDEKDACWSVGRVEVSFCYVASSVSGTLHSRAYIQRGLYIVSVITVFGKIRCAHRAADLLTDRL